MQVCATRLDGVSYAIGALGTAPVMYGKPSRNSPGLMKRSEKTTFAKKLVFAIRELTLAKKNVAQKAPKVAFFGLWRGPGPQDKVARVNFWARLVFF